MPLRLQNWSGNKLKIFTLETIINAILNCLMQVKPGVEEAKKLLVQASDLLPVIRKSIHLGTQPIVSESKEGQSSGKSK